MSEVQDEDEVCLSLGEKQQPDWQAANKDNCCLCSAEITWIDYIQLICIDWKVLFIDQDNQQGVQHSLFTLSLKFSCWTSENSTEQFLS